MPINQKKEGPWKLLIAKKKIVVERLILKIQFLCEPDAPLLHPPLSATNADDSNGVRTTQSQTDAMIRLFISMAESGSGIKTGK